MLKTSWKVTREEVYAVDPPEFTDTWRPIAHRTLIDLVCSSLDSYGLRVWKSEFGMSQDKHKMFGVLDLQLGHGLYNPEFTMSVGLRNSTDKSLAASVVLGNRVFVCDNLCFTGEVILTKRHDAGIDTLLPRKLDNAVKEFIIKFQEVDVPQIALWKQKEVSLEQGTEFICEVAEIGAIPVIGILKCREYFRHQKHPELQASNVWALMNAITQYQRDDRAEVNPQIKREESLLLWKHLVQSWPVAA